MNPMFSDMTKIVPVGKFNKAEVRHRVVTKLESVLSSRHPEMFCLPGKYAVLIVNGRIVMSNTRMECVSNIDAVINAKGRVLIAGLGLGLIVHPILKKKEVESVTVVELSRSVIKLISPTLPKSKKLKIVHSGIFKWDQGDELWDTIYFDIWPEISEGNLKGMDKLHHKFKKNLAKGGWMDSWMRSRLLSRRPF